MPDMTTTRDRIEKSGHVVRYTDGPLYYLCTADGQTLSNFPLREADCEAMIRAGELALVLLVSKDAAVYELRTK